MRKVRQQTGVRRSVHQEPGNVHNQELHFISIYLFIPFKSDSWKLYLDTEVEALQSCQEVPLALLRRVGHKLNGNRHLP